MSLVTLVTRVMAVSIMATLMACGPKQVQLPPERSYHRGFSLVPPNEQGWFFQQRDHNTLVLARHSSGLDETYVISTEVRGLPPLTSQSEFINAVKEMASRGSDPTRFTVMKLDVVPYSKKGDYCARSYLMAEDRAAVRRTGGVGQMVLELVVLSCRHPTNADVAINVVYSHRHYPDQGDPNLSGKADMLFESVEFTDLR